MAEIEANVVPLNESYVKLVFINYDHPEANGITEVTYDGNTFDVIFSGNTNNSYLIVDASFSDFDNLSRVIIEADL